MRTAPKSWLKYTTGFLLQNWLRKTKYVFNILILLFTNSICLLMLLFSCLGHAHWIFLVRKYLYWMDNTWPRLLRFEKLICSPFIKSLTKLEFVSVNTIPYCGSQWVFIFVFAFCFQCGCRCVVSLFKLTTLRHSLSLSLSLLSHTHTRSPRCLLVCWSWDQMMSADSILWSQLQCVSCLGQIQRSP